MKLLKLEIKKTILFGLILIGGVLLVSNETQARISTQSGYCSFSGDTYTYCYPNPPEINAASNERVSSSRLDFTVSGGFNGSGDVVLRGGTSGGMSDANIFSWSEGQCGNCPDSLTIGPIGSVGDGWTDFFIQGLNTSSVNWTWTVTIDVYGCTDPSASNFNPDATIDDGSCTYPTGAVQVQSTFAMTANITGPQNYNVSTGNNYAAQIFWQAPLGTYTISNISNINCYSYSVRPPGTTQTITTNGEAIFFIVDYTDSCPTPSLTFTANPSTINYNTSSTLTWTVQNAQSCTASGDWSGSKAAGGGSESTGNITSTKTYTLTCYGQDPGDTVTKSVTVTVTPPAPNDPSNITVTAPNYCVSGPAATIGWTYSDPSGSPQSAYEVQMDEQGSFQVPEYQTGKVLSNSNSNFTGQGILLFNKTYKTRVRVWNSFDVVSDWTVAGGNFNTPPYAYPQVDFSWTANGILNNPSPPLNKPVDLTDATVFNGNPNGRRWSWLFGDGGSSILQNPSHTYVIEGSYYVTLTATDNANQTCARTKGPLIIQKPIPRWREIAPR